MYVCIYLELHNAFEVLAIQPREMDRAKFTGKQGKRERAREKDREWDKNNKGGKEKERCRY